MALLPDDEKQSPIAVCCVPQIRRGVRQEHFVAEPWGRISDAAKHLVCQLLVVNPQQRLTVGGALQHVWLRGDSAAEAMLLRDDISDCSSDADELEDRAAMPAKGGHRAPAGAAAKGNKKPRHSATGAIRQTQPSVSRIPLVPPPAQPPVFKQPAQPHPPGRQLGKFDVRPTQRGGYSEAGQRYGKLAVRGFEGF